MSSDMTCDNIEIDLVKPIRMFDTSNNGGLNEAFCWKNTQPPFEKDHQYKGRNFDFHDYQLQFIRAYQFIKLTEEENNEDLH